MGPISRASAGIHNVSLELDGKRAHDGREPKIPMLSTRKATPETADAPLLEPATQQFVDAIAGGPIMADLSPHDARKFLADIQSGSTGKPAVCLEERVIPVGPTGSVRLRIVRPEDASEALPALVYVHGGGWIFGDEDTHDRVIREIAVGANVALFFVDYDLSSEV